jgi:hypothetical protein
MSIGTNSANIGDFIEITDVSCKELPNNTGATLYPQSQWIEFEPQQTPAVNSTLIAAGNNAPFEWGLLYQNITGHPVVQTVATTTGIASVATPLTNKAVAKVAGRIEFNDVIICSNGTLSTKDSTASYFASPTKIEIGGSADVGQDRIFGYIRRAAIFNSALSDANLQKVTS